MRRKLFQNLPQLRWLLPLASFFLSGLVVSSYCAKGCLVKLMMRKRLGKEDINLFILV